MTQTSYKWLAVLLGLLLISTYWLLSWSASVTHAVLFGLFWGGFGLLCAVGGLHWWQRHRESAEQNAKIQAPKALLIEDDVTEVKKRDKRAGNWLGVATVLLTGTLLLILAASGQRIADGPIVVASVIIFFLFCAAGLLGSRWWLLIPAVAAGLVCYFLATFRIGF